MIDNSVLTENILTDLEEALPLPTRIGPSLAASLQERFPGLQPFHSCEITEFHYAGDEGGIMCALDLKDSGESIILVSITHLSFDPRHCLSRRIAAYQKRRIKGIRKSHLREFEMRMSEYLPGR